MLPGSYALRPLNLCTAQDDCLSQLCKLTYAAFQWLITSTDVQYFFLHGSSLTFTDRPHFFSTCYSDLSLNLWCDKIMGEKTCSYTTYRNLTCISFVFFPELSIKPLSTLASFRLLFSYNVIYLNIYIFLSHYSIGGYFTVMKVKYSFVKRWFLVDFAGVNTFISFPLIRISICSSGTLARRTNRAVWWLLDSHSSESKVWNQK